jgi:hypothetical protein
MMKKFQNKVIIAALMLCLGLYIFCPVSGYAAGEEAVYITINQADQNTAGEAGIITLASEGSNENAIEISLDNPTHKVAAISMSICTEDNYLTLAGCDTTDRTGGFLCRSRGSDNGCCSVTLFSMNRLGVIEEGAGPIFILRYTLSEEAPAGECTTLTTENTDAIDDAGSAVEVVSSPGEYCFGSASSSCEISISPETAEVGTGETIQFDTRTTGTGCDNPCYGWQVTGTGGGSIDTSGLYTAGAPGGTDLITVIDDCQGEINATAAVFVLEDADEDDILDEEDGCLASNLEDTISIYSCDSGVENLFLDDGCSLNDLIAKCDHTLKIHGMFVSCVSRLSNGWRKEGWISWKEKGAIQRCAAKSWIERKQVVTYDQSARRNNL